MENFENSTKDQSVGGQISFNIPLTSLREAIATLGKKINQEVF